MIKAILFDNDGVMSKWLLPRFRMRRLAKQLRQDGIKVGMLSNVIWGFAQVYKLTRGYDGYDLVLLSYKEKMSKPNPDFYMLAVKKFGLKPHEILFVDNRKDLLVPAQKLGFKTLHSKSARQLLVDINHLLSKENKRPPKRHPHLIGRG